MLFIYNLVRENCLLSTSGLCSSLQLCW